MALPHYEEWPDAGPIPPELIDDEPHGEVERLTADAFDFAEQSEVELVEAVEMLADAEPDRWRIRTDDDAEWALRHLAEARAELERLRQQSLRWQERIEAWFRQAAREPARRAEFFQAHAEWYGRRCRAEGRKSVKLPSGTIATRSTPAAAVIADPVALVEWAREALPEAVRVREDVLVSTLRKLTDHDGERVVVKRVDPATGELTLDEVPGAVVEPEHVTVKVDVS